MEKSEPSLVPEWLKNSGTSSPHRHQQDEGGQFHRQRSVEQNYSYAPPRRLNNSNNNNNTSGLFPDRFPYERDIYPGGNRVYPNFGRGTPPYPATRSEFFEKEWDSERLLGISDHHRSNGRWPSRGDHELPVRRPVLLGNGPSNSSSSTSGSTGFRENGNRFLGSETSGGVSGGPVQKAAFERNFPSLGGQEKPAPTTTTSIGVYSSLANVAVLSPRHHHHLWQSSGSGSGSGSGFAESRGVDSNGAGAGVGVAPGAPRMVEALVQNPPRVKTPPQLSAEAQRLEELQLKQSRQLVPVMPKTTTLINSRDKSKSKSATPASKINPPSNTQVPRPGLSSVRPESNPKTSQSKLQVLKPGVIPESTSAARNPAAIAAAPRKQKQLLDRRQVPIPPLTTPSTTGVGVVADVIRPRSSKDNGAEDKRANSQAQNRIDFFNAIRKKAATNAGAATTSTKPEAELKVVETSSSESCSSSSGVVTGSGEKLAGGEAVVVSSSSPPPNGCFAPVDNDEKQDHSGVNGVISEEPIRSIAGGSEEEENRFLRSLGWVEDAGGEGELTEEEINAFYQEVQEHMRSKTCSPLSSVRRLQNAVMSFRCTGMNSFTTTGINSSDSESDCEARATAPASRS